MRVQNFTMTTSIGLEAKLDPQERMIGYLPVYDNYEDALADFPDGPIAQVVEVLNKTGERVIP